MTEAFRARMGEGVATWGDTSRGRLTADEEEEEEVKWLMSRPLVMSSSQCSMPLCKFTWKEREEKELVDSQNKNLSVRTPRSGQLVEISGMSTLRGSAELH